MAGVGTRKTYEDDRVVIWNLDLEPGEEIGRHTHTRDYFVRIITGSTLEVYDGSGKVLRTSELEDGSTVYFRLEGKNLVSSRPGEDPVPVTHGARNIGTKSYREVLIEFKQ